MKKAQLTASILFVTVILLLSSCSESEEYGVLNDGKMVVKLEYAGTISASISTTDKNRITDLTVIGKLNNRDMAFIKEMCGYDDNSNQTGGNLRILDISSTDLSEIRYRAFTICPIQKVKLPESIMTIGTAAFRSCSSLIELHCKAKNPPSVNNGEYYERSFEEVDKEKCKIYVPKGCATKYKDAVGWKDFKNIIEE